MLFKVYLLRRRGRRLSWKQVERGASFTGPLTMHTVLHGTDRYEVITLHNSTGGKHPEVPDLYEPSLTGFAPNAFGLRGYERIDDPSGPIGVVQEWRCELP
jgi:hypothetical protein